MGSHAAATDRADTRQILGSCQLGYAVKTRTAQYCTVTHLLSIRVEEIQKPDYVAVRQQAHDLQLAVLYYCNKGRRG